MKKRLISWLLCAALTVGLVPAAAVPALAAELKGVQSLSDDYISVSVSEKNGGFTVKTVEGDRLKKSDNNKDLLYHDGEYDTSFLSFRVGSGQTARDYLFGGSYAGGSKVSVTKSAAGDSISAVWSVDGLTFTQTLSLAGRESNESGMVSITVSVKNDSGAAVPVQARLLLDTSLGEQDYGYYQYTDSQSNVQVVSTEQVITGQLPQQLFAADDLGAVSVMAYTIHNDISQLQKIAFGHWSHLASTLFDFTPSQTLNFTNDRSEYLTADSAYALYYDLGSVQNGGSNSFGTYYGVFSNYATPADNSVAVNLTAPIKLTLNDAKDDFVPLVSKGEAHFSVVADFVNTVSDTAQDLSQLQMVVRTSGNLRALNDNGERVYDFDSGKYTTVQYSDVKVGQTNSKTLYFAARPVSSASYERITIGIYDVSDGSGVLSESNKLGERVAYVLLPGTDSDVPKISFSSMSPKIVYTSGTRHLYITVADGLGLLEAPASARKWSLSVISYAGEREIKIDHANISFQDGVMDVAIPDEVELAEGAWYVMIEWDPLIVGEGENKLIPTQYAIQTAPELNFTVSSDIKYKNDSYGILAVVEYQAPADKVSPGARQDEAKAYRILPFADEADLEAYKTQQRTYESAGGESYYASYGAWQEIVFVLKGEFAVSKKVGNDATYYTAVSVETQENGKAVIHNPILINNCLDFEKGTISVYYENYTSTLYRDSTVCIEFDGKLYTNGARTGVWNGKGFFTPLEQYTENYSLTPYDQDGNRISLDTQTRASVNQVAVGDKDAYTDTAICVVWPTLAGTIGQTLAGMVVKLAYGEMGAMYQVENNGSAQWVERELGTVVSFAASLDLSFATGKVEGAEENEDYFVKLQRIWTEYKYRDTPMVFASQFDQAFEAINWRDIEEGDDESEKRVSASVMVRDVVFGCGQGFIGINFTAGVGLQNYIPGLPNIQGKISVNTINDWSFGIDGEIELSTFKLEASVSFRSKDNIPIPDNFYVFVSGVTPGLNIDGCGVIWLTGAGGGINNLYETIFCTGTLPPLKLLLSVSFDILKVLSCEKATLSVGPTGISLSAENIGMKYGIGKNAISRMGLSLEWYPGIDLRANIVLNLLQGVIKGGGYLVVISPDYKNVFFEMFARGSLNIPASIPVVGGMQVAGVDLGINSEKIWGAVEVLLFTLGATYYWGEDSVDFSDGSKAEPTFPELLGCEDIPVGYNTETGETLYMRIGTNTALMATNLEGDGGLVLMAGSTAALNSNVDKTRHTFSLGSKGDSDALVQVTFPVTGTYESEEAFAAAARTLGNTITVGTSEGADDYGLIRYDGTNLAAANANLSYDYAKGTATFAFSATTDDQYGKTWHMSTPAGSDVLLYNVAKMPEVTEVRGTVGGTVEAGKLQLDWGGTDLAELDQISFYLCESNTTSSESPDPGHRVGVETSSTVLGDGSVTLNVPADVPTGEYYVRAVYSKENEVNGVVFSGEKVRWTNDNTPGDAVIEQAEAAGNLQYRLTLREDEKTDGYLVTIYQSDGVTPTDFEQVSYDAAQSGGTTLTVGGSYTTSTGEPFGLTSGQDYIIGVTPYRTVRTGSSGEGALAVRGRESRTGAIHLPESKIPTVTLSADSTPKIRTVREYGLTSGGQTGLVDVSKTVYTTDAITFTATADETVTGSWKLDDSGSQSASGTNGSFTGQSVFSIPLTGLEEGEHTLTLWGQAEDGDSFRSTYSFTVDTLPPQLLLASPVNGSLFGVDGSVTFTGVTDPDARFTITSDYGSLCSEVTMQTLVAGSGVAGDAWTAGTGEFSVTLPIPDANRASEHTLTITVSDDVGNASTRSVTLTHGGLADLESLEILVNGQSYPAGNLSIPAAGLTDAKLTLMGVTSSATRSVRFALTGYNVSWQALTVSGSASLENDSFTAAALSQGLITGKLAVASGQSSTNRTLTGTMAYRTAALCFGAPVDHTVLVSSGIGGTVSGGGEYQGGQSVTLTATPDSGYRFVRWVIAGAAVADPASASVTFLMPERGNVTVEAVFEPVSSTITDGGSASGGSVDSGERVWAQAGELVRVQIPAGKSAEDCLPSYTDGSGSTVFVPIAAELDGDILFLAPVSGTYRLISNPVSFSDIDSHWAREGILFCARRGIFNGIGSGQFDPNGTMTRAMLATVLYRLAGSPAVSAGSGFTDVKSGQWYSDAIAWGESTGILTGYGDGRFGTEDLITREQLCTLLTRYLKWAGYQLKTDAAETPFADQAGIADWAAEGVSLCQRAGLITGKPNNLFAPRDAATRGENCVVFQRMILAILSDGI